MNLASFDWEPALLDLFKIPRKSLPALRPSSGAFGQCKAIPELTGVPIVAILGDSHAALVGHGQYAAGTVKATYGTGSSLMMLTPDLVPESSHLARTIAWSAADGAQFALEGNIAMSGAAVQWVGEFLGLPHPIEDAVALADTVPIPRVSSLCLPWSGSTPHWDSAARGLACNLERSLYRCASCARQPLTRLHFKLPMFWKRWKMQRE